MRIRCLRSLFALSMTLTMAACAPCVGRDGLSPEEWRARERSRLEPKLPALRDSLAVAFERFAADSGPPTSMVHLGGATQEVFIEGGAMNLGGPRHGRSCIGFLNAPSTIRLDRALVWLTPDGVDVARVYVSSPSIMSARTPEPPILFGRTNYPLSVVTANEYRYAGANDGGRLVLTLRDTRVEVDVALGDSASVDAFLKRIGWQSQAR